MHLLLPTGSELTNNFISRKYDFVGSDPVAVCKEYGVISDRILDLQSERPEFKTCLRRLLTNPEQ